MRPRVLRERQPFAAFPRLEAARRHDPKRVGGPAGLVVEVAELDREVVARAEEGGKFLQGAQAARGGNREAFPELVAFVEQARVARVGPQGGVVGAQGDGGTAQDVPGADPEIAPRHRVGRLQPDGALPEHDGLAVAAAVVEQVSEIKRGTRVAGARGHRIAQNGDFLETRGETIVRPGLRPGHQMAARPRLVTEQAARPRAMVMEQRERTACGGASGIVGEEVAGFLKKSGAEVVEGEVETDLHIARERVAAQVARPPIERVEGERRRDLRVGFGPAAKPPKNEDAEVAGVEMVGVEAKTAVEVIERDGPLGAPAVELRERVVGGGLPRLIPRGLVEGVIGLGVATEVAETNPQLIMRLPVGGVGVAEREPRDARPEMAFGVREFTAAKMPATEGEVATRVAGIAPEGLAPVKCRTARGVAVLLQVEPGDVEFVRTGDRGGRGRFGGRGRHRRWRRSAGRVAEKFPAVGRRHRECQR